MVSAERSKVVESSRTEISEWAVPPDASAGTGEARGPDDALRSVAVPTLCYSGHPFRTCVVGRSTPVPWERRTIQNWKSAGCGRNEPEPCRTIFRVSIRSIPSNRSSAQTNSSSSVKQPFTDTEYLSVGSDCSWMVEGVSTTRGHLASSHTLCSGMG